MDIPGSKLITLSTESTYDNQCICGDGACGKLSLCYQSIGDARGCKIACPTIGGKRNKELKEFKLKRAVLHLGLAGDYTDYATIVKRNKSI